MLAQSCVPHLRPMHRFVDHSARSTVKLVSIAFKYWKYQTVIATVFSETHVLAIDFVFADM